ncbi:MAG: type II secretion system F family protein [Patescibacteria group bacterium]|nr:type II secretion system F family protein [Patescibacteria group bacterium]
MKRFKFKAKNQDGKLMTGEVESPTAETAAKLLQKRGLFVISISDASGFSLSFLQKMSERIKFADLVAFTRQLATMINSGLPLTEALSILSAGSKESVQKIVNQILADVQQGESLSFAMAKHPKVFSKNYIALVKAGETSGVLDEILTRLANDLEKQQEFQGKVKGALVYPVIIVVGMIIVAFIMMIFVVPRLTSLYGQLNADLPITTKILMSTSDFMVNFWPIILIIMGALAWGFKLYRDTKDGRLTTDEMLFKIPIIGELMRTIFLTDFTRTLSLMIGAGVSILESLSIVGEAVPNVVISNAVKDVAKLVEKGFPLGYAFARHPDAFPFILAQMVSVGEETGKVDEVLQKVSHVFEVESEQKVKALTTAIEPAILIILGIGVAFLIISVIMPIYNLTTNL